MSETKKQFKMIQGNTAIAEGAIAAGCNFFGGYPITPSSEVAEALAHELPKIGGSFIQMEDEIAAMGAVIGASLAGAKALTATSGPGFSLKQENIGFACMAETPVVIANVMRGGPSTGLPTKASQSDVMQARWGTHGDHPIIAIAPASVEECFHMTVRAFNLSEKYRTPVVILADEIIAHLTEKMEVPAEGSLEIFNRVKPTVSPEEYLPYEITDSKIPPMANFGEGYRYHVTGLVHDETGFPTNEPDKIKAHLDRLNSKLDMYYDDIVEVDPFMTDDMDTLVIAYGSVARSARSAVMTTRKEGHKAGLLMLKTLWPFPEKEIIEYAKKAKRIIVPEMNLGQVAHEIEWATRRDIPIIKFNKITGEPITPGEVANVIKGV